MLVKRGDNAVENLVKRTIDVVKVTARRRDVSMSGGSVYFRVCRVVR